MIYRPYERNGKYPHFASDMSHMVDNLALQFGVFYHCNHVFSILNVEQYVLNFRGKIMYIFIACRVLSDGRLDPDIVDFFSAATGDHKWIAAHRWYQASGKPQVTFEETRQKMIDEFLAS